MKILICHNNAKNGLAAIKHIQPAIPDGDLVFWEDMALEIRSSDADLFQCEQAWAPASPAETIARFNTPVSTTTDIIKNSKTPVPLKKPIIKIWCKGRNLLEEHYDLCIMFGWYGDGKFGGYRDIAYALGTCLRDAGTEVWNEESSMRGWMSKIGLTFLLAYNGCLVPDTLYAPDPAIALACLKPGKPYVVKDVAGTHGNHNYLTDDPVKILNALKGKRCVIQTFIPNTHDLRVICYGAQAVLVMERARKDDSTHLNNTSQGGNARWKEEIQDKLRATSHKIAKLSWCEMAGIDFVETKSGDESFDYWCLEVNVVPQLTSGFDVPTKMKALSETISNMKTRIDGENRTAKTEQQTEKLEFTEEFRDAYGRHMLESDPKCWYDPQTKDIKEAIQTIRSCTGMKDDKILLQHRDLLIDVLYTGHILGFTYKEYFTFHLGNRTIAERLTFISSRDNRMYNTVFNTDTSAVSALRNKYKAYNMLRAYYKRDMCLIDSDNKKSEFDEFCTKHAKFFIKPVDGGMGRGTAIMNISDYQGANGLFDALLKLRQDKKYDVLCEELIIQDDAMAMFHPKSVNSIRACVYLKSDNEPVLIYALFRAPKGNMIADNFGPGHMMADIDIDTGVINADAHDFDGNVHETHPDTGVKFRGFRIPMWAEMKTMLSEIAILFHGVRLQYWDLALSKDKGWMIIEGNTNGVTNLIQFTSQTGCRRELEKKLEWDLNHKKD